MFITLFCFETLVHKKSTYPNLWLSFDLVNYRKEDEELFWRD